MAPNTPQDASTAIAEPKPVSRILIYMAMAAEAAPLVKELDLQLRVHEAFPPGAPWQLHSGESSEVEIHLVTPGKDSKLGVDNVGTVPASLAVYASAQAIQPDLIINAGTAGGFKAKGASIGDVYLATHFANHDRRIPLPGFEEYGIGLIESPHAAQLANVLGFKLGRVSSGNSLDMSAADEKIISRNEAAVKDMEAAGIAWVASVLGIPLVSVKTITDIVDGDRPTTEEFLENLHTAAVALQHAVPKVVALVGGKPLVET